jgi:hypothetical protein
MRGAYHGPEFHEDLVQTYNIKPPVLLAAQAAIPKSVFQKLYGGIKARPAFHYADGATRIYGAPSSGNIYSPSRTHDVGLLPVAERKGVLVGHF